MKTDHQRLTLKDLYVTKNLIPLSLVLKYLTLGIENYVLLKEAH